MFDLLSPLVPPLLQEALLIAALAWVIRRDTAHLHGPRRAAARTAYWVLMLAAATLELAAFGVISA